MLLPWELNSRLILIEGHLRECFELREPSEKETELPVPLTDNVIEMFLCEEKLQCEVVCEKAQRAKFIL